MRVSKRIVAEQFVPTSTTPPSDVGIYRVNRKALGVTGRIDTFDPEISVAHHRRLDGWVRYRAYMVPDSDFGDKKRAEQGLADFEDYFGRRPDADHRRNNNANRPHRVRAWV